MKKFIRNLLSGYLLVILMLLIELGIFVYIQFFFKDSISSIISSDSTSDYVKFIVSASYISFRLIMFCKCS